MLKPVGRKRDEARAATAAALATVLLSALPASADGGDKLELGGFMARAYGLPGAPQDLGKIEIGAGSNAAHPAEFAPSSVGLPLDSGWVADFMLTEGAEGASPALNASAIASKPARSAVSYFTPRFSGLQFGAAYAPPRPEGERGAAQSFQGGQEPALGSEVTLGMNYLESFRGVDVALSGGYRSASLPDAGALDGELSGPDTGLQRYSVGTSIGFSGFRLGGFYAREVGDGPISVHSWDAGVSYASGPWTLGVDYLRSAFVDARRTGAEGQDELHTVQAGVAYSVGPGIVASFNVLHSSLEDREGNATAGTLGILGFSYNF